MKRISSHYYYRIFLALPLLEGLVVAAALLLAGRMLTGGGDLVSGAFPAGVAGVLAVLGMTTTGLYNYRLRDRFGGVMVRALLAFAGAALLAAALYYLLLGPGLDMTVLAWSWALAFSLVLVLRAGYFRWLGAEGIKRRVLILGAGRRAQPLSRLRRRTDLLGLRVVGFVALPSDESRIVEPVRLVELDRALPEWVAANGIDEIVVALDERRRGLGGRGMDVEALLA
ncbi:nucleoside-diphosphate sugar epimerase/dehydratase, partial [Arhodomonas sp. KWT]